MRALTFVDFTAKASEMNVTPQTGDPGDVGDGPGLFVGGDAALIDVERLLLGRRQALGGREEAHDTGR
jgi:hypothetical protein